MDPDLILIHPSLTLDGGIELVNGVTNDGHNLLLTYNVLKCELVHRLLMENINFVVNTCHNVIPSNNCRL